MLERINLPSLSEEELVKIVALGMTEDGFLYKELPYLIGTYNVSQEFYQRYHGTQGLFITVALINEENKLLVIKNKNREGYELVGGKVDELNFKKAAIREVKEEVSLDVKQLKPVATVLNKFVSPVGEFWHFGVAFYGKIDGTPKINNELEKAIFVPLENASLSWANSKVVELVKVLI